MFLLLCIHVLNELSQLLQSELPTLQRLRCHVNHLSGRACRFEHHRIELDARFLMLGDVWLQVLGIRSILGIGEVGDRLQWGFLRDRDSGSIGGCLECVIG